MRCNGRPRLKLTVANAKTGKPISSKDVTVEVGRRADELTKWRLNLAAPIGERLDALLVSSSSREREA